MWAAPHSPPCPDLYPAPLVVYAGYMSETITQQITANTPTCCDNCGADLDATDTITVVTTFVGGRIAAEKDYCDERCAQQDTEPAG